MIVTMSAHRWRVWCWLMPIDIAAARSNPETAASPRRELAADLTV